MKRVLWLLALVGTVLLGAVPLPAARRRNPFAPVLFLAALLLFPVFPSTAAVKDGSFDTTFCTPPLYKVRLVRGKADYADGRYLLYGYFNGPFNWVLLMPGRSIVRFKADGTLDDTFAVPVDGEVRDIQLMANGQIYIAGKFTINSSAGTYNNLARLNDDGTVDVNFPKVFSDSSGAVNSIGMQSDGKILVGGYSMAATGITANTFHLIRLKSDGTVDGTYPLSSAAGGYVSSVKILNGDAARLFGTLPRSGTTHVDYLLVLASTGVVQANIGDETVDGPILNMGQQSNGQWLIAGQFKHVLGVARNCVARFKLDMSLDTNFDIGTGANGSVSQLTVQGDDKIVLAGNFDSFNGTACGYLVRLNNNGAVDSTFNNGTRADASIVHLSTGPGGSGWLIYGYFLSYNSPWTGAPNSGYRAGLASLDANGNLTSTYNNLHLVAGNTSGKIYALAAQSDGKILVGGDFTGLSRYPDSRPPGGVPEIYDRGGFVRLNPDGSVDTSFKCGVDGYVDSIAVQADGKILLAGSFGTAQSYACTSLARLNVDGSFDTTFKPLVIKANGSVSILRHVVPLSGGQIMVAGDFARVNGTNRTIVARLNSNGSLDTGFNAQLNQGSNIVGYRVAAAAGNYVVSGSLWLSGIYRVGFLTRFTNTGALDTTFGPAAPAPVPHVNIFNYDHRDWPDAVGDLLLQRDGKIMVSGSFYRIDDGSGDPPYLGPIARFSSSGLLDNTFPLRMWEFSVIAALALQPDGKIIIGGYGREDIPGVARLYPNGRLDYYFTPYWGDQVVFAILRLRTGRAIFGGIIVCSRGNLPCVFARSPDYNPAIPMLLLE